MPKVLTGEANVKKRFSLRHIVAVFIVTILIVVVGFCFIAFHHFVEDRGTALTLNLLGRQRMMAQRFVRYIVIFLLTKQQFHLDKAKESAQKFEERMEKLLEGGEVSFMKVTAKIPPIKCPACRDNLLEAQEKWKQLRSVAQSAIQDGEIQFDAMEQILDALIDSLDQASLDYQKSMELHHRRSFLVVLLFAVFSGLVFAVSWGLLKTKVLKPIASLTQAAHELSQGNWETSIAIPDCHELSILASTFDTMRQTLCQQFDALLKRAKEWESLNELLLTTIQRLDPYSIARSASKVIQRLYPNSETVVFAYEPEEDGFRLLHTSFDIAPILAPLGFKEDEVIPVTAFSSLTIQSLQQGQVIHIGDFAKVSSPIAQVFSEFGQRSAIAAPIWMGEGELLGFIGVIRTQPDAFTDAELSLLQTIGRQISVAFYNAQLFEQLQKAYTDLKETQTMLIQQERLKALGQMASGVVHDVGNALVPTLAAAEDLMDHPDPVVRAKAEQISQSVDDILHIIDRLRTFYRSREPQEELEPVDLNKIARQVVDLTRPRWYDMAMSERVTIEMRTVLDETLPPIAGIASEVREALINLVFNAVDAILAKGEPNGRIEIATGKRDKWVFVEVRDTGIGMDEETKIRCLEPFFTTKGERGTGLGLMMVYGVIQRHEGDIEIESEVGKGSTFRLLFPMKVVAEKREATALEIEVSKLSVLLADDDPRVRNALAEKLRAWGHEVTTAHDGEEAWQLFRKAIEEGKPFDLIITDFGMPKMGGDELLLRIKRISQSIPVLVITGWGKERTVAKADKVLSKPVRWHELKEAIAEAVKHKQVRS